ncbi:MAG: hypothetical protein WKF88_00190 [Ferruginibacter sp.]
MKSFLFACCFLFVISVQLPAQPQTDTLALKAANDSLQYLRPAVDPYKTILDSNTFFNGDGMPRALPVSLKKSDNPVFFYIIIAVLLFLGIMKTVYSRYFNTLFRVFFNTSLRQNQLTDQLEQAVVPSFLLICFFASQADYMLIFC